MLRTALKLALLSTTVAVPCAEVVEAQTITSTLRGTITGPEGSPVSGATVEVIDTRTGRALTVETGQRGNFSLSGLRTGGPYNVLIRSERYRTERVTGVNLSTTSRSSLDIALQSQGDMEEIVVTASSRQQQTDLAIGPASSFGSFRLENLPSTDRDFRDILRVDPRVQIDQSTNDRISCVGSGFRSNSFTVDGVDLRDPFGLEDSGFPSENNQPIPFDAAEEVSVEFAPFDVEFARFTGCNINVASKSGSNEFHGSVFGQFTSDSLQGASLTLPGGDQRELETDFDNWQWGVSFGGPIVEDKLFFFVAYEQLTEGQPIDDGPRGGGFANEFEDVTLDLANEVGALVNEQFGFDTGTIGRTNQLDNNREMVRLDWLISDRHRLAVTYNREREENIEPDGLFLAGFGGTFAFRETFENEGTESDLYSGRLFSQWTDNFSTELRFSRLDVTDIQNPVGFNEAQQQNPTPQVNVGVSEDEVILGAGPGVFRSANELDNTRDLLTAIGDYQLETESFGTHNLKLGYEWERAEVFNLFVINATGRINFANPDALAAGDVSDGSINPFFANSSADELLAGNVAGFFGNGSFTGDIEDAAAEFERSIHSVFLQDEWEPIPSLTVTAGLRYDFFQSDDRPRENALFIERFGFSNATGFDDFEVLMPRLGINYSLEDSIWGETNFRGGVGVFAGGDPTVFFSNAFSNSGNLIGFGTTAAPACDGFDTDSLVGPDGFTGVPDCVRQQQIQNAQRGDGRVDAISPNLDIPRVIRANFGFTHYTDFNDALGGFFDDWQVRIDVIHSRKRDALDTIDISQAIDFRRGQDGFTRTGRPIRSPVDPAADGCDAEFIGPGEGFNNVTEECFSFAADDTTLLRNVEDGGSSTSFSAQFQKQFTYELFGKPGEFNFSIGYNFLDVNVVSEMASSTATGNLADTASFDPQNKGITTANSQINHNIVIAPQWRQQIFGELNTRFGLFFQAESGQPFSFVFDSGAFTPEDNQALFYVPTGPDDPNVDFSQLSAQEQDALFEFINNQGLSPFAGGVAPRNEFTGDWNMQLDLRFQQELPGLFSEDRFIFFADFENLPNMISDDLSLFNTPAPRQTVVGTEVNEQGQFVFQGFDGRTGEQISTSASLWSFEFGVRYRF